MKDGKAKTVDVTMPDQAHNCTEASLQQHNEKNKAEADMASAVFISSERVTANPNQNLYPRVIARNRKATRGRSRRERIFLPAVLSNVME